MTYADLLAILHEMSPLELQNKVICRSSASSEYYAVKELKFALGEDTTVTSPLDYNQPFLELSFEIAY